ncbi:YciI family protein [Niabella beijingensis]|uniref:YciI family protein n=1 Tax=Niabella beijingensis TaxID=2872700 RepID=UPI001CBE0AE6|nr:YciI family protein [Niabella beijingensis]MBZ4187274.1 YciI family protein [Niabella beijingensis]
MKEFLLLIRENPSYGTEMSSKEMQDCINEHIAWVEELTKKGNYKDANPLEAAGAVIKNNVITDGPYIESKECVSGIYFLKADSLEAAIELVKDCPDLKRGNTIEVREIMQMDV